MTRILFTGGGTAGHVTPNIALIEAIARTRPTWEMAYAGSPDGIEARLIAAQPVAVVFHGVASGKLRRYFSWQNFIDPFRVLLGILQALGLMLRWRPDVVFSKGGFVSVPVVVAAWLLRIPVVSHESDVTPGLANRLTYPFCHRICVTFEETCDYLPKQRVIVTGTPVRQSLLEGDPGRGRAWLGFTGEKPVLLVFGGSLGATAINRQVRAVLPRLLALFDVVHVTGESQVDPAYDDPGYRQHPFIGDAFGDVLAAASLVICRAGANSLYELFLARRPHLLIPLTTAASRGDQLVNARLFTGKGFSRMIEESALSDDAFMAAVEATMRDRDLILAALEGFERRDAVVALLGVIEESLA